MGTLLSAAFNSSEQRTEQPAQPRSDNWLEAAVDGLLTLEGERFMLSLPDSVEPNSLAVFRPQIINELAQLRRFKSLIVRRIEEMLKVELRHCQDIGIESRLREELLRLRDWFNQGELSGVAA